MKREDNNTHFFVQNILSLMLFYKLRALAVRFRIARSLKSFIFHLLLFDFSMSDVATAHRLLMTMSPDEEK